MGAAPSYEDWDSAPERAVLRELGGLAWGLVPGVSPGEAPALAVKAPWERREEAAREEGSISPWEWGVIWGAGVGVTFWPEEGLWEVELLEDILSGV